MKVKCLNFVSRKSNLKNQTAMKKFLTLTLVGMTVLLVMASCKSSSGGHCDAYGKLEQVNQSDLARK
jgi:hypothetical protein